MTSERSPYDGSSVAGGSGLRRTRFHAVDRGRELYAMRDGPEIEVGVVEVGRSKVFLSLPAQQVRAFAERLIALANETEPSVPAGMPRDHLVDTWLEWADFRPLLARPYQDRPVWIGLDLCGTEFALAVAAPAVQAYPTVRLLESRIDLALPRVDEVLSWIFHRYCVAGVVGPPHILRGRKLPPYRAIGREELLQLIALRGLPSFHCDDHWTHFPHPTAGADRWASSEFLAAARAVIGASGGPASPIKADREPRAPTEGDAQRA